MTVISRVARTVATSTVAAIAMVGGVTGPAAAAYPTASAHWTWGATAVNALGTFYNRSVHVGVDIRIPAHECRGIIIVAYALNASNNKLTQLGDNREADCNYGEASGNFRFDIDAAANVAGGANQIEVILTNGGSTVLGPSRVLYKI
ncbi:hypothetical protein ACTOB_003780 [Actinoplanes oblitus]|uniref:Uncharacterized protein n=1 Tax=Actinoplanes oblitus TaxID=3040509 RepID=A0ABY8WRL5_9ACTN|nr:hypothetical protein [Actinoplanes oblitus]WIN00098.1 hypothetical protein ACTOB_003780 [Actinoplanes oblitus]